MLRAFTAAIEATDRWMFPTGDDDRGLFVRRALALLIALRVALGPYRALAGQPAALFRPLSFVTLLPHMPSLRAIVAVQVVGTVAGVIVVFGRAPRAGFAVSWCALIFLAGLRTSLGKVLHNDVLLLLVAAPFLLAGARARWPRRTALVVVAGAYLFAGLAKLRYSGLGWVTSDNFRFVMYSAARSSRVWWPHLPRLVADTPWLSTVSAAFILSVEVTFPVVLWWRRARLPYALAAVYLHVATWFTLGIDYWLWAAVVPLILLSQPEREFASSNRRIVRSTS